jgi:hypothetical protein
MYKAPLISALILLISLGIEDIKLYIYIYMWDRRYLVLSINKNLLNEFKQYTNRSIQSCYKWFCKTMFGIELNDRTVSCRHNKRWTLHHISSNLAHDMLYIYRVFCSKLHRSTKDIGGFLTRDRIKYLSDSPSRKRSLGSRALLSVPPTILSCLAGCHL